MKHTLRATPILILVLALLVVPWQSASADSTLLTGLVGYWTFERTVTNAFEDEAQGLLANRSYNQWDQNDNPRFGDYAAWGNGSFYTSYIPEEELDLLDGSFTVAMWWRPGVSNGALLAASNGSVNIGSDLNWGIFQEYVNGTTARARFYVGDGFTWSWGDSTGIPLVPASPGTYTSVTSDNYTIGEYYLIVARYDSVAGRISITVNDETDSVNAGPVFGDQAVIVLGTMLSSAHRMDDVAFWDRALTDGELAELYYNGEGNPYPFVAAEKVTVTVSAIEDATIINHAGVSTMTFDDSSVRVGDYVVSPPISGTSASHGLIKFNLNSYAGSVTSATLRINATAIGAASVDITAHQMNAEWFEQFVTWDTSYYGQPLEEFPVVFGYGTPFDPNAYRVRCYSDLRDPVCWAWARDHNATALDTVTVAENDWYELDVTSAVADWLSGGINYGFMLKPSSLSEEVMASIFSSESSFPPELVIEYLPQQVQTQVTFEDPSFEMSPQTSPWITLDSQSTRILASDMGYSTGPAYCGAAYMAINRGVTQRFYWPGGTAYLQLKARNVFPGEINLVDVKLRQLFRPYTEIIRTPVIQSNTAWTPITLEPTTLLAGWYEIEISEPENGDGDVTVANVVVDDVTLAQGGYQSYCTSEGGPTITPQPSPTTPSTPTPTNTPTGTRTPTASPTNTVTPTPGILGSGVVNCSFEAGLTGWQRSGAFSLIYAGAPVGPQAVQVGPGGRISQLFAWPGGDAYVSFWVSPGGYGNVRFRNYNTNQLTSFWVNQNTDENWKLIQTVRTVPAGNYWLEIVGQGSLGLAVDGVALGQNGYQYCEGDDTFSGTPNTPTPGPTAHVTLTPSPTPVWTATPSRTPTPTQTRTPLPQQPTWTPTPTRTPVPTNTQPPTPTQIPPELTATAQGTDVPTYTPQPTYTPYPTPTPQEPVPAPPNWGGSGNWEDCERPQTGDWTSWWIDQQTCVTVRFFSWNSTNSQQAVSLYTGYDDYEPFGTINELRDTYGAMQTLLNQYDWANTGNPGQTDDADPNMFILDGESPWNGGEINIRQPGTTYSTQCNTTLLPVVGTLLSESICWTFDLLNRTGIMPWFQAFANLGILVAFVLYIKNHWVEKATSS